jgi:DinB superfamily
MQFETNRHLSLFKNHKSSYQMTNDLRYPIGKFVPKDAYTITEFRANLKFLDKYPANLKKLVSKLTDAQLDTPYRPEGWTVRQVVHHVADSHANMMVRVKLALTEVNPAIKPYEEQDWANLADYAMPLKLSLNIIEGLHKRLVVVLKKADKKTLKRTYFHPANNKISALDEVIAMYVWHSEHHYQHINQLIIREKW